MQQQWTISQSGCDMRWKVGFIWQPVITSLVVGPRGGSKASPKAKLEPKKGHGHCLVVCCPTDPLKLSESRWNRNIWEVCSANHWDALKTMVPEGQFFSTTTPHHTLPSQRFKNGMNWATKFCLIHCIHLTSYQPTTISSSIWTTFAGKTLPPPAAGRKCFPRVRWILKHEFLHGRNKLISQLQKICWF